MPAGLDYTWLGSPVGALLIAGDKSGLRKILFAEGRHRIEPAPKWRENARAFDEAVRQLKAYFSGDLRNFDLPLAPEGTPFQLRVWQELLRIPYGSTISYGELAARLGDPQSARAVGLANGANPIAIIIPCHRVIGSNGALTGYGGGLRNKKWLLDLEHGGISART